MSSSRNRSYRPIQLGVVRDASGLGSLLLIDKDSGECIGPQRGIRLEQGIVQALEVEPHEEPEHGDLDGFNTIWVSYRIPISDTVFLDPSFKKDKKKDTALVVADWLEEHGEESAAKKLRTQFAQQIEPEK